MARSSPKSTSGVAATTHALFVTTVYQAALGSSEDLNPALMAACLAIAEDDTAGQEWCAQKAYPGYTSYASLNDLEWRDPSFKALGRALDKHVGAFAEIAQFDLGARALVRDSLWINVLEPGGFHSGHIHPHSAVSGTYYVSIPDGASALRFEDPRLGMMMAAPPRRSEAAEAFKSFVPVAPQPGMVLLWESWLRHEVLLNEADDVRVSISFNYRWG